MGWGRRLDRLTGGGVDHVVLNLPVLSWSRGPAPHAFHEAFVDFPDQPFRDGSSLFKVFGDEIEGSPVVQPQLSEKERHLSYRDVVQQ